MNALKSIFLCLFMGAVVGTTAASWLAPSYLAWNNTPGQGQALCDCVKVTRDTAHELIQFQIIGAGAGAVLFLLFGVLVLGVGRRSKPKLPPTPPIAPLVA